MNLTDADLAIAIESLRQQRERLTLWLAHNAGCKVGWISGRKRWHDGDEAACTCGLAEALGLKEAIERG